MCERDGWTGQRGGSLTGGDADHTTTNPHELLSYYDFRREINSNNRAASIFVLVLKEGLCMFMWKILRSLVIRAI